jgi:Icc-related predicted phosphoesterase
MSIALASHMTRTLRVAAIGDLHCTKTSEGALQPVFAQLAERADILALCGDLTDYGTAEEAKVLAKELAPTKMPKVAVLGNHDFESSAAPEVARILTELGGVTVLDGTAIEIAGVGFAGAKGFAGGFGARALQSWGEDLIKAFVRAALDETLKLETALARLRTPGRVALLHYAPISGTVEGEPIEIFPFLGSSRLEEPLNRYAPSVVFHGHAHRGKPAGATATGIPVYNVAMPLLRREFPDQLPFRVVEVPVAEPAPTDAALARPEDAPAQPLRAVTG